MHTIDRSHLPVMIVHTSEPMTLADAEAIQAAGVELLERQQPFALILSSAGGDHQQRERGVNARLTQWLKANKPHFERWCVGLATVVPTARLLALYKPMVKMLGPRLYGCPAEIFTDLEAARVWAQGRLAAEPAA
jgi:hypothetical protein